MIRSQEDLMQLVEEWGFVPFFASGVPGFSIEEQVDPSLWFSGAEGPWEWKGPVIQATRCAYGKFFRGKAVYISPAWFPDFANCRRDGYDFDARWDDGLASRRDKELYDLIARHAPILSRELKSLGNYKKGSAFDSGIARLQSQCYVITSDFVYARDKHGKPYGWGLAQYDTPERFLGEEFTARVYRRSPEESRARVLEQLRRICPSAPEQTLERLLG